MCSKSIYDEHCAILLFSFFNKKIGIPWKKVMTQLCVRIIWYLAVQWRQGPLSVPRYPLLLCLGKSLVVIPNYALTAEQPDPCGPEPCSPGRAAPDPLPAWGGSGDATYPGGGSPQPKQLGPRTSQGVPDPCRLRTPYAIRTPQQGGNRYPD